MKYCKDCCFYKPDVIIGYAQCLHLSAQRISRVDGKPIPAFCNIERSEFGSCGLQALRFKPIEAYAEYLRDQEIEARQERKQDRAEEREERMTDYERFEMDEGARL